MFICVTWCGAFVRSSKAEMQLLSEACNILQHDVLVSRSQVRAASAWNSESLTAYKAGHDVFFGRPAPPPSHTTVVCTYITLPGRSNFLCSFVPPKQQERIRKETSTGSLCGASVAGTTNQHLAHKGSAGRSAAASNCLSSWTMNDDVQSWRTGVAILYYLGGKFQQGSFGSVEFLLMAECCKWISVPCWEGQASARRISIDIHKLHFKSRHNLDI